MAFDKVYKVVVVEDESIILGNIKKKIEGISPLFKVVGTARNGMDAIPVINSIRPDILFTDIRMPKMDGLELVQNVKELHPDMQIVIISGYNEFEYAREAIKLGVKEYLIKPVDADSLKDILLHIKKTLDLSAASMEKAIMVSVINGSCSMDKLPYLLSNGHFLIFLICIGHICNRIPSNMQLEFFTRLWTEINWNLIIPFPAKWWVINENYPNQKCLVLLVDEKVEDPVSIAQQMENSFLQSITALPVNICISDSYIPYLEIYPAAQRLRMLLDQSLIPGKSMIFTPSSSNRSLSPPAILDMVIQNKIIALINQGNAMLLQQELFTQFNKWEQAQYPQRWIEKVLHQLLCVFHRQCPTITEKEIAQMEYELFDKLSIVPTFSNLYEDIWSIFNSILMSGNNRKATMNDLIGRIEKYINVNYTSDLNIEEIARKFNLNPTYLSKVFKKHKNVTPSKYITTLKINEAKHLIETNPELGIKEIGEIVGYTDQHYFSRVFKCITRKTPTEYKENVSNLLH